MPQHGPSWQRRFVEIVALTIFYVAVRWAGQGWAFVPGGDLPLCVASGVAPALLLLRGMYLWPGVLLGAVGADLLAYVGGPPDLPGNLGCWVVHGVGETLAVLAAAWLIRTGVGTVGYSTKGLLSQTVPWFRFVMRAALLAPILSTVPTVICRCLVRGASWDEFSLQLLASWLEGGVGILILTSAVLSWGMRFEGDRRWGELGAFVAVLVGATLYGLDLLAPLLPLQPRFFLVVLVLSWGTYRFDQRVLYIAILGMALLSIGATQAGHGPLVSATPYWSLINLQLFLASVTVPFGALRESLSLRAASETALRRSEERLRGLLEERLRNQRVLEDNLRIQTAVGEILRLSLEVLPLEQYLQRALDWVFSVPSLSLQSQGAVFLIEDEPGVLVMKARRGLSEEVVRTCQRLPVGRCLGGLTAGTQEIVFADRVDSQHDIAYPGMSGHAHYCVPILSENELYGVMNLHVEEGHPRVPAEEQFLVAIANALAGVLRRQRAESSLKHREAQLLAARDIQEYLLPPGPPTLPGFDIAAATYPAEFAAGDHYDYLHMLDNRWGFVVGDVCGKGVAAAIFMADVHSRLRVLAQCDGEIDTILARLNAALVGECDPSMFVTIFFGCLDPVRRTFLYANAGHPTGYVLDAQGGVKATLSSTASPVAIGIDTEFPVAGPITLQPGDLLLLLTDGVLEATSLAGEHFGTDRMLSLVRSQMHRSAQDILDSLCRTICDFTQPRPPQDDVTAVILKVTG